MAWNKYYVFVKGAGVKDVADLLLKEFKSVKKISEQPLEPLEKLVGFARAKIIFDHFRK